MGGPGKLHPRIRITKFADEDEYEVLYLSLLQKHRNGRQVIWVRCGVSMERSTQHYLCFGSFTVGSTIAL